jgi:hypothetical protein
MGRTVGLALHMPARSRSRDESMQPCGGPPGLCVRLRPIAAIGTIQVRGRGGEGVGGVGRVGGRTNQSAGTALCTQVWGEQSFTCVCAGGVAEVAPEMRLSRRTLDRDCSDKRAARRRVAVDHGEMQRYTPLAEGRVSRQWHFGFGPAHTQGRTQACTPPNRRMHAHRGRDFEGVDSVGC